LLRQNTRDFSEPRTDQPGNFGDNRCVNRGDFGDPDARQMDLGAFSGEQVDAQGSAQWARTVRCCWAPRIWPWTGHWSRAVEGCRGLSRAVEGGRGLSSGGARDVRIGPGTSSVAGGLQLMEDGPAGPVPDRARPVQTVPDRSRPSQTGPGAGCAGSFNSRSPGFGKKRPGRQCHMKTVAVTSILSLRGPPTTRWPFPDPFAPLCVPFSFHPSHIGDAVRLTSVITHRTPQDYS